MVFFRRRKTDRTLPIMDTKTTAAAGVAGGPAPAPAGGAPAPGAAAKGSPGDREAWRIKSQRTYWRRQHAAGKPVPDDKRHLLAEGPVAQPQPGPPPPPSPGVAAGPAPVPWDPGVLRPLFETVIPEIEKLDVQALKTQAAAIGDPAMVALVEKDAPWNPAAKATVITTGPQVVSNLMNAAGISAEHAPAIALTVAVSGIIVGRSMLSSKLEEIARKLKPKGDDDKHGSD